MLTVSILGRAPGAYFTLDKSGLDSAADLLWNDPNAFVLDQSRLDYAALYNMPEPLPQWWDFDGSITNITVSVGHVGAGLTQATRPGTATITLKNDALPTRYPDIRPGATIKITDGNSWNVFHGRVENVRVSHDKVSADYWVTITAADVVKQLQQLPAYRTPAHGPWFYRDLVNDVVDAAGEVARFMPSGIYPNLADYGSALTPADHLDLIANSLGARWFPSYRLAGLGGGSVSFKPKADEPWITYTDDGRETGTSATSTAMVGAVLDWDTTAILNEVTITNRRPRTGDPNDDPTTTTTTRNETSAATFGPRRGEAVTALNSPDDVAALADRILNAGQLTQDITAITVTDAHLNIVNPGDTLRVVHRGLTRDRQVVGIDHVITPHPRRGLEVRSTYQLRNPL
ncbi:hypothetical protein ACQCX5_14380 [Propionibacteriaceae bacterium G57]|uniref:hypothetical protein n=1 Tax=Aestuariimicrobium sp. G57 TaxID=3418485 RepID=UPI003DA6E8B1